MIKRIYALMLISLFAASCSKGESACDIIDSETPISFAGEELTSDWGTISATRGLVTDDVDNAPSNIMVYSFLESTTTLPYINNQEAVKDPVTNLWGFDPAYFYPLNQTLSFLAYIPKSDLSNGVTQTPDYNNKKITIGYEVPSVGRNQPDLMLAMPKSGCSGTNQVGTLDFKHVLTKVMMSAKMADGTADKYKNRYKITRFTFHNIKTSGSLDYSVSSSFGDWYGGEYSDYAVEQMLPGGDPAFPSEVPTLLTTGDDYVNVMNNDHVLFMVPQPIEGSTNVNGAPSIQITITDNEETIVSENGVESIIHLTYRTGIIPLPSPYTEGWKQGQAINLQFEFTFDPDMVVLPMSLTAKLMNWTEQTVDKDVDPNIHAWLDVMSVPANTTTTLKLYTNGVATPDPVNDSLGAKVDNEYYPVTIISGAAGTNVPLKVVLENSYGKTITKTFHISVE